MALIIRIDVDRPYGRQPLIRHVLSRFSSDFYLPRIQCFGYLKELDEMLQMLNERRARAYVFFRRCTIPFPRTIRLLEKGGHEIGLHLEDSRSFETFESEKRDLEHFIGKPIHSMSKHGSGGAKYGRRHHAPYEPERYIDWACQSGIKVLMGNLEDPTLSPTLNDSGLQFFPSAFWLEPFWRDTQRFSVDWLLAEGNKRDVVMLVHPENILASPELTEEFKTLVGGLESKVLR